MELSDMLISQFVKATNDDSGIRGETTAYGTIVTHDNVQYVMLDGSIYETPVVSTTEVNEGDRVLVRLKNHTAMVTNNLTNPSIGIKRAGELESSIKQTASSIDMKVADKVNELSASLSLTVDGISTKVTGIESTFSEFKQTVEGWTFKDEDGTVKIDGGSIVLTGCITFGDLTSDVSGAINNAGTNADSALSTANTALSMANTANNTADSALSLAGTASSEAAAAKYNAGQALTQAQSASEAAAIAQQLASNVQLPGYLKSTYIDQALISSPTIVGGSFYAVGQTAWTTMSSDGLRIYTGGIAQPKIELVNYASNYTELLLGAGTKIGSTTMGRFSILKHSDKVVLRYYSGINEFLSCALVLYDDGKIELRRDYADTNYPSRTTKLTLIEGI